MRFANPFLLVAATLCACDHHSDKSHDMAEGPDLAQVVNTVPLIVDGYNGQNFNTPYITITLCAPGDATNCMTIDHVLVDTGSVGLRVPLDTLSANPTLFEAFTNEQIGGQNVAECYVYASGYIWGSVRTGDLTIAGERAASVPFQIGGDLSAAAPAECVMDGMGTNFSTSSMLGGNAIIGVAPIPIDCGQPCALAAGQGNPSYYGCAVGSSAACTALGVPAAQQVPQPVTMFAVDNNGVVLTLPSISDSGAANATGTLTFGIDTQSDNALGSADVFQPGVSEGLAVVTTTLNGTSFSSSVFDSGTPFYTVGLDSVAECMTGMFDGFYCPTSPQTIATTITDANMKMGMTTVKIANAETLNPTGTAFDDLALDGMLPSDLFIVGLSHFYGKTIYFGIEGAKIGTYTGPLYAF